MLNRLCLADGVPLVNIVRSPEQVRILRGLGANHIVNSAQPTFRDDLVAALKATGASLAFDAIGGGKLASQILSGMEIAASASAGGYNMYGSTVYKQVYIYGGLDTSPTELTRGFGMAWASAGGCSSTSWPRWAPRWRRAEGASLKRDQDDLRQSLYSYHLAVRGA